MENYWLKKLEHINEPEWPYVLADAEPATAVQEIPVNAEVLEALHAISGGSELNMLKLLLGGLGIVLWKYTGQKDIAIAMPPLDLEDTDANASGSLYCVLELHSSLSVGELLEQVHVSLNEAHVNSEYDEASLRELFNASNVNAAVLNSVGLSCAGANIQGSFLHEHKLVFEFTGTVVKIISRNLPVPQDMLRNMAASMLRVASNFGAYKEKTISQLPIVANEEVEEWRAQFEKIKRNYPVDITVVDLFEQQVRQNPEKIALICNDEQITYKALDKWSANIAGYIVQNYQRPGQMFIGVMIERSPALVATVLGILRAGAAYVPVDPAYPPERMRQIIADAKSPMLFTDNNDAVELNGCHIVNIFSLPEMKAQQLPATSPNAVAYIIYSSGTTGKPKGIMIQHKAILNLLHWYNERYEINNDTRIVQLTNIVVDIAFQEIFSALMNGLTLYIPRPEEQQDKQLFLDWLEKHRINFIQLIPDMLATYFADVPKLHSLDLILCGGDKLSEPLKDKIAAKGYKLYNIYGQTETAIDTVGAECLYNAPMCFSDYVPNYEVFILDEFGNACPEYVAGEICTAGEGLALGYLNNPQLTAEKFVPHPFEPGQRMYKTGDRARRMPDGSLRLLGREDQQVKLRGFRIELEEIEGVLHRYPGVESAAVAVKEMENGDKELVAFVVGNNDLDIQHCVAYVKERLPAYMLPAHFVQIDKLPLTAVGKVNRKELALYEGTTVQAAHEYIAPRNKIEAELAAIWEEVLNRKDIGVKDDFFELGGHSLKVTRLVSRIRKVMGVAVSLKEIFLHPVLEVQAELIAGNSKQLHAGIPALPAQEEYELSSAQSRLWMLCQFEGSNAAYNIPGVVVFEGPVDREALSAAFAALIERHEVLRTVFRVNDAGAVHQHILTLDESGFELGYEDLRNTAEQQTILQKLVAADFHQEFNLSAGPLLRANLYQVENQKWVFTYVMHHIISDDWSMGVLFNDLLRAYQKNNLPPLRIQYKDYAAWQRKELREATAHKDYWLQQFEGEVPVLELPLDKPRPAVKTYNGGLITHNFGAELSQRLQKLLREEGCTLFMGVLSTVNVLLHRYTGQQDIVVGSPVAGREHSDLEEQIGFYVNTIALRSQFTGTESFRGLLQLVKQVTLGAYAHQTYPFDVLVNELSLQHDPSRSALFDVVVALQNAGNEEVRTSLPGGLKLSGYGTVEHVSSKFDLVFNFQETNGTLQVAMEYNSDLFENATILRMATHLQNLMAALVADADDPLYKLNFLSAQERTQLLEEFNASGDARYPDHETIVSLFEEQVKQTPNNIAVVFGEKRITYAELNSLANQLAHYLRDRYNVQREQLIALLLERNEWMPVSILAVLKAGGVYVPMDPQYPQDRIDFMMSDSGCKVLVDAKELEQFKAQSPQCSKENPVRVNQAADLAYVIYTSGTTGQPKGSLISHYQVVRLLMNDENLFDFGGNDVWTLFHSYCFDFSVWEMYGALLFGGAIVVVPLIISRDPAAYLELLIKEKVTVLNQTPSSFYNLIKADEERDKSNLHLRYVIFGGEALSPGRLRPWHNRYPQTKLINMYGITETTVHVTYKEIGEQEISTNISNIGKPIPTLSTYVLDAHQQLVPIGVWGELYVGGAGVARGYLNREALTASRFISSWFKEGDRLYRSGDKVRVMADGEMEYSGRLDEQVKIRGHRIELGEIASALEWHEEVSHAVVIAGTAQHGAKELVAYITAGEEVDMKELRAWLSRQLPDYMLPAYIIRLDTMPLTSNGKIDRKRLPAPDISMQLKDSYTAPENEMQQLLAEIWQQVLGIGSIGIHDNFFSIGGNSISMIEVVSAGRRRGVAISIRQMFEQPTIALLSAVVKKAEASTAEQGTVMGNMQLLPVQQWYFENQREEAHHFNYSTFLFAPAGMNRKTLEGMITALVKKHDALRLRFPLQYDATARFEPLSPKMVQQIIEVVDHSQTIPEERAALVTGHAAEMQQRLNLYNGPLCRFVWYNYGDEVKGRLLVTVHHLVTDGVSWRLLINEFQQLFAQLEAGQAYDLGSKTTSYKRWSEKLSQFTRTEALQAQREYWYNVVKGADTALPVDQKINDRSIGHQQQLTVEWDEEDTGRLLYQSLSAYNAQVKDILLAALMIAICKWRDLNNFLVHQEGHGREDIFEELDLSQTMGWFTSIYPVLLRRQDIDFETGEGLAKTIKYVKENLRGLPNNGIGYSLLKYFDKDEVIRKLELDHPASILFNYLGEFNQHEAAEQINEKTGVTVSALQKALYALEFNGGVLNKRLRFAISFSHNEYRSSSIEELAHLFKASLNKLVGHCVQQERRHFTPADFPLAAVTQSRIEELEDEFPDLQELYPATPMQKGMYFHSFVADEGAFVVQQHGHLKNIDPAIFAKAWQHLISRHAVLRTVFVLDDKNGLLQIVCNNAEIPHTIIDCSLLSQQAWERKIAACIEQDASESFDFEKAPLLRYTLLKRDERTFYILLSVHHIILDGWSMPVLFSELMKAYRMLSKNEPVVLPPVPDYGKYVHWLLTQNESQSQAFWKNKFNSAAEITQLALLENAAPEFPVSGYREVAARLSPEESELLRNAAAKYQVTLHTLLVAAWAWLLSRYTGYSNVAFGMTISGRSEAFEGVGNMVGLFINTIPIKVEDAGGKSPGDWLKDIHNQQMEYNQYGVLGLSDIRRLSNLDRDAAMFESLLVHQNYPMQLAESQQGNDAAFEFTNAGFRDENNAPLTVMVFSRKQLSFSLIYKTEIFRHAFIDEVAADFRKQLIGIAMEQDVPETFSISNY